jgi:hypothetical protein
VRDQGVRGGELLGGADRGLRPRLADEVEEIGERLGSGLELSAADQILGDRPTVLDRVGQGSQERDGVRTPPATSRASTG